MSKKEADIISDLFNCLTGMQSTLEHLRNELPESDKKERAYLEKKLKEIKKVTDKALKHFQEKQELRIS